jgi:hypothetical protein
MIRKPRKTKQRPLNGDDALVDPAFRPIVDAFAGDRSVSRKRMFSTSSVLSVNGKIFAMTVKGKFVAKLPKSRVDELVRKGKGKHFDPGHGRIMKEWVALSGERGTWRKLANEAYDYVKR